MITHGPTPVEVFCSYASEDEPLRQQIEQHLSPLVRQGLISLWYNRLLPAGTDWANAIDAHLETASLILLLLSASFFDSDYCFGVELQRALERHKNNEARIIPILLRAVEWQIGQLTYLQVLPTNAIPVTSWSNQDEALADIVAGIRRVLADLPLFAASLPRTALPVLWNIPYSPNPFFLGRDELLLNLHRSLNMTQTNAFAQPHALSGLGGIGKTQLAIEYAYRFHQNYEAVFWVRAENHETLFSSYTQLATLLSLPEREVQDQERIVEGVKRWLQQRRKWLLIFDNADELDLPLAFFPSSLGGHILLTTRAQDMQRLAKRIDVEVLQPQQGALLLLQRAGLFPPDSTWEQISDEERILALQLVEHMGGLPLALDQAGAYIEATSMSLEEYHQIYLRYRRSLHRQLRTRDYPESVATTWNLAFRRVEQRDPAAADLLRLCAFFAPDAIPEEMITLGAAYVSGLLEKTVSDSFQMGQAIEVLRLYSLINRSPRTKTLSVHRLVQLTLRDGMEQDEIQIWLARASKVIANKLLLDDDDTIPQEWHIYIDHVRSENIYNHVRTCVELLREYALVIPESVDLLHWAGFYLAQYGQYEEARLWCEQSLQESKRLYGVEHKKTAEMMQDLGWLYRRMGRYIEAEELFLQALANQEQQSEPEYVDIATTLNVLAFLYTQQRRYVEAEPLFLRALVLYEQYLGSKHLHTAQCLSNLAFFYTRQGAYQQAENACQRALTVREQILGSEHPAIAESLQRFASLYQEQGRYTEAEFFYRRALAIYEQQFKHVSPYTQATRLEYASLLRAMGRDQEAQTLEEKHF